MLLNRIRSFKFLRKPNGHSNIINQNRNVSTTTLSENDSYLKHDVKTSIEDKTIGVLFEEAVKEYSSKEYLVSPHQNIRLTYSEALKRVDRLASGLKKLGLQKGDRIGLWGPNEVEWNLSLLAASRAGLITVAINPAYQYREIEYCLNKASVKAVIAPESFKTQNYLAMLKAAQKSCPSLQHIIIYSSGNADGARKFSDIEASATNKDVEAVRNEQNEISCHSGCNIQFTSGTTGLPKATLISHRSLVNNSKQAAHRTEQVNGKAKICLNVPFFHAFGMVMGQLLTLHGGSTLILESPSFNPVKSLETVVKEKCSTLYGTPTMWVNLVDAQRKLQLPINSLLLGAIGGAPAPAELFKRIKDSLNLDKMSSLYGLTETTAAAFQTLPGDSQELRENTVGHLSDHLEALVVDEKNKPVEWGKPGELWVRGYTNMLGYWEDEVNTKKMITDDNWVKTGDQFILHKNGYGQIVGRLKDMIIRGGENIFPKEIEDYLVTHKNIQEVHAFGVPCEVYGEEVCAAIKTEPGVKLSKDDILKFCKGNIAHFKIPKHIKFVDNFPKTTSGKIKKHVMKDEFLNEKKSVGQKQIN